ncbi:MAG: hypothetical protein Kow00107_10330 [Planctomycetota bacterium]
MPCCLGALLALLGPRVFLLLSWLFTDWTFKAFEGKLWPLLGWLFMPWTTTAYMVIMIMNDHKIEGLWIGVLILGVIFDIGSWGAGGKANRHRD